MRLLPWIIVVGTFAAEASAPLNFVIWQPYLFAIVLSVSGGNRTVICAITAAAAALTMLGVFMPSATVIDMELTQRFFGAGMIILCGALCLRLDRSLKERQTAVQRLEELNETLEKWIGERTDELRQRNEALSRSNQELDEFAYITSHDLKEPLRGIRNFAQFLIEDYSEKLDEPGQQKLHTLIKLSTRLEALIDSLHQFSRVGRIELALAPVDLHTVVEEVIESLRFTIDEAHVEVRIPRRVPVVICDGVRIGEVFHNLLTNAIKYNDKTEKWVEIGYLEGTPPTFFVRDNGIGIRDRHQDSIFRMFKRLHGRDEYGGGTGVGLTIVKKLIERHGGRVWLESVADQGSTFYFTLAGGNAPQSRAPNHDTMNFGKPDS